VLISDSLAMQKALPKTDFLSENYLFFHVSNSNYTYTQSSTCSIFKIWYIGQLSEHKHYRGSSGWFFNSLPNFAESPTDHAKASLCDYTGEAREMIHYRVGFFCFLEFFLFISEVSVQVPTL